MKKMLEKWCLGGNPRDSQKLAPLFEVTYLLKEMPLMLLTEFSVLRGTQIPGFATELSKNVQFFFLCPVSLSCSDFKCHIKKSNRKFQINTVTLVLPLVLKLARMVACILHQLLCSAVLAKMT